MLEIIFWILVATIFYTYAGYGAVLFLMARVKDMSPGQNAAPEYPYEPKVTLLVAAYNEEPWVEKKIQNSFALDYPPEKLKLIWVTDGSNDNTVSLVRKFPQVISLHKTERRGKMAAINRGMTFVDTDVVVFSDADTLLSRGAIREMVPFFQDPQVGCVCGERQVRAEMKDAAAVSGENVYWRYESWIKRQEALWGSCIGAAGELFAIRRRLFRKQKEDTLIDDFAISMGIALEGYRIAYAMKACAVDTGSANIHEEFKRKTRIAAGNMQAILRMPQLLNPFQHTRLTFQYVSHKFLRSFVAPLFFALLVPINVLLLLKNGLLYVPILCLQALFYLLGGAGYFLRNHRLPFRLFFVPYYIITINLSAMIGCFKYLTRKQSVLWERAIRKEEFLKKRS